MGETLARATLVGLALLRLAFAFAPGYVHPDEWFQSNEVTAANVFGTETRLPWEYTADAPARSILGAYASSGLSYLIACAIARATGAALDVSWVTTYAPRLALCAASATVDLAVVSCARAVGSATTGAVNEAGVLFATSWVTLVLLVRPFSNSLETYATAACALVATTERKYLGPVSRCVAIGTIWMVSSFIRFTSGAFIAPWAVYVVARAREKSPLTMLVGVWSGAMAAILTAVVCIVIDTAYFSDTNMLNVWVWTSKNWIITPWNSFRYNVNADNLARHGLHPRYLHVLVNGPLMFSVLWLVSLSALMRRRRDASSRDLIVRTLWASVLFPLAALSLAPHQEPRFLTPMILPMCVLAAHYSRSTLVSRKRRLFAIWIAINALLACLFGVLHQGGVVRSMRTLAKTDAAFDGGSSGRFALFWKTYSPPLSILAQSSGESDLVSVYDAAGASVDDVRELLLAATSKGVCVADQPMCTTSAKNIIIIAPALAFERLRERTQNLDYERVLSIFPHLSLDHLDDVFDAFASGDRRERFALVKKSLQLTVHRVRYP